MIDNKTNINISMEPLYEILTILSKKKENKVLQL